MATDDIYILGITMTKFGKHKDKDVLDLATEAALGALKDGGVSMKDMGVLAAGNLMGGARPIAQEIQKQIGQTGIPAYNVSNACATGATALRVAYLTVKSGEADFGIAVGVEQLAGAGLLAGGARKQDGESWQRSGRYG
ncbi:thiolase family protein, partial [Myxococcota bacterium]|nr:thiolase family protein [Myxococcota bacterium]